MLSFLLKIELELNFTEHVSFKIQVNIILVHTMIAFPDSSIKKQRLISIKISGIIYYYFLSVGIH